MRPYCKWRPHIFSFLSFNISILILKLDNVSAGQKPPFLAGRTFWNVTDLNLSALDWCDEQNTTFHRGLGIPQDIHRERCGTVATKLDDSPELPLAFVYVT